MRAILLAAVAVTAAAPAMAQDGLWNQAEAVYGAEAMRAARHDTLHGGGHQRFFYFEGERLEWREGGDALADLQSWYGGDLNKLWLKAEAEYSNEDGGFEEAEIQALYSRAISDYFDLQAGVRQDLAGSVKPTYAVLGVQGVAPYWFEIDAAAFLSDAGDLTAVFEAEYELLLTQRLILQPRAELALAAQDVPALGIGAGFASVEAGARLRYEITRQFAPYAGVSWARALGDTADFARAAGEDPDRVSAVAGLRIWF